jgi:hypothetical protein
MKRHLASWAALFWIAYLNVANANGPFCYWDPNNGCRARRCGPGAGGGTGGGSGTGAQGPGGQIDGPNFVGDPIATADGNGYLRESDVELKVATGSIAINRMYNSSDLA